MNGIIEKAYAVASITPISPDTTDVTDLGTLVSRIATWLTYAAGVAAFIYLVYSGILYISAAGNPDQAKKGQQGIINAIIGIVIIVLAYTIISVVQNSAKSNLT
jgi:hypothetical protein